VQAHPQKFPFVKNLGKIPENPGKNDTQHCLTLKNGAQHLQKTNEDLFSEVTPKKDLHDFCGKKFAGKSHATNFWASLGKFRIKSFAPSKISLLLHLCLTLSKELQF